MLGHPESSGKGQDDEPPNEQHEQVANGPIRREWRRVQTAGDAGVSSALRPTSFTVG
jgi:hypothetical protein